VAGAERAWWTAIEAHRQALANHHDRDPG
jgi:hypothetical protein